MSVPATTAALADARPDSAPAGAPLLLRQGHIPALDGVRGLAILVVMLFHFSSEAVPIAGAGEKLFYGLLRSGWWGVDLFFVLSGFLITGILHDTKASPKFFRTFYMRRVLRIFPLYYLFLLALLLLSPLWPARWTPSGGGYTFAEHQLWYWTYFSNLLPTLGMPADTRLGHFWSLAIEEQFYLVWPAVVFLCSQRTLVRLCLAMMVGAIALRLAVSLSPATLHLGGLTYTFAKHQQADIVKHFTLCRVDALGFGALIALLARTPGGLARLVKWAPWTVLLTVLPLPLLYLRRQGSSDTDPLVRSLTMTTMVFFSGALLTLTVAAGPRAWLTRIFGHPLLRFFGRYSYGMYVYHFPLRLLTPLLFVSYAHFPGFLKPRGSQVLWQLGFMATAVGLTLGVSLLSWYLLEKPCLQLKRFFEYRPPARRDDGSA